MVQREVKLLEQLFLEKKTTTEIGKKKKPSKPGAKVAAEKENVGIGIH
jgi:hypothetical protein